MFAAVALLAGVVPLRTTVLFVAVRAVLVLVAALDTVALRAADAVTVDADERLVFIVFIAVRDIVSLYFSRSVVVAALLAVTC